MRHSSLIYQLFMSFLLCLTITQDNNTMVMATPELIEETMDTIKYFFDYAATHPDTKLRYHRSNMILHVHSDGSYLSVSNSRRRVGGRFFLSKTDIKPQNAPQNGAMHVLCTILKISWRQQVKPSSGHYSSTPAKPPPSERHWSNSAILNHRLP